MIILTFDNQLADGCITGLPTRNSKWLQGSNIAHQMRLGSHEGAPCLQQKFDAAGQTNQDTRGVDATEIPPYLKRKLMRHDGMACSPFMVFAWRLTAECNRQDDSVRRQGLDAFLPQR